MKYDVIVCGGGPSGMTAAISARRNQANVLLIEASGLLGGASTLSSVGPWMTFHNHGVQIIRGIAEEVIERLQEKKHSLGHIGDPIAFCDTITPIDPEGVKELFFDYIQEEKIDLLLHAFVSEVIKEGNTIKGVKVQTKSGILDIFGDVIIDATGDGDVCRHMNCRFVYGSEKDHLAQPMTMMFTVGNIDFDQVRTYVRRHPEDFVLRKNDDLEYIGISGFFSKIQEARENHDFTICRDRVLLFQNMRKNEATVNMTRVMNLSAADAFERTKAEIEGRKQIKQVFAFLKKYIPGFENSDIVSTPAQIGIRETYHITGEYILNADDIAEGKTFPDSVCLSGFPIDIHSPRGDSLELIEQNCDQCCEIPLRVLIPEGVNNLIVTGRCISATHEACASIRVTPTVMALGEAAGVLGALSAKTKKTPKDIDYVDVQKLLQEQGQIVHRDELFRNEQ